MGMDRTRLIPDPELIGNAEGNKRELREDVAAAEAEQLTFDGESELIQGVVRDEGGKPLDRWVRLTRTTTGVVVHAPEGLQVHSQDNSHGSYVTVYWPHAARR